MQVKKFEAKSMKEALDLVKVHLGPEAIILSARDSHKGFGLMGDKSVEITAAVSDETLRKKLIAEAKLKDDLKQKFQQIPASRQKEFINKAFKAPAEAKRLETVGGETSTRPSASTLRYIDIPEDEPSGVEVRIQSARGNQVAASSAIIARPATTVRPTHTRVSEVDALRKQVQELRQLVEKFQSIPQIPMSLHPGAEQGLPFEMSSIYKRLTHQGLHPEIVSRILKKAVTELDPASQRSPALVDAWLVGQWLHSLEVVKEPIQNRYHLFFGPSAQGKTTSLVKLASHLVLKEKRTIAIVSFDTLKVGAADQLRIYAQILNVPFAIVRSQDEWRVADAKLRGVQHILVDAPGLSLRRNDEMDWLRSHLPPSGLDVRRHFVQSMVARDEDAIELAARYQAIGFHDVVFTRMDECSRNGFLVNFQERFRVPFHSFGVGPRIPEDYEFATKERVIDHLFNIPKQIRKEEENELE